MKKYLYLLLCLSLPVMVKAQARLYGKVTDGDTKQPVSYAPVRLYSEGKLRKSTLTDENGNYVMDFTEGGSFDSLMVKVSGYANFVATGITLSNSQLLRINAELGSGEVIVVRGNPVLRVSTTTQQITSGEDFKKTAATDLTQQLGVSPGVSNIAGVGLVAKGAKVRTNQVYVDGVPYTNTGPNLTGITSPANKEDANSDESYSDVKENSWIKTSTERQSTFSIDVDNASYTNIRRFLNSGSLPPKDAVRIEEMINYFTYNFPQPEVDAPFSINSEMAACPWETKHQLLLVNLQGRNIAEDKLPAANLVFLIDVSGSMDMPNKLPLVKQSLKLLAQQLRSQDKVSIVVYAGAAGLALPATSGSDKQAIYTALDNLEAGGSTAGGRGIELAYKVAKENFIADGNNRVILATDGDFNVGVSSDGGLEELITEKRKDGIFLSALGFGMGNYKDSKIEILADKGNGNYAYIDTKQEAEKVLVKQFGGTMYAIAKDVKLQITFNPKLVKSYRLIGYENRVLANKDFTDDTKDAGELGSGHTVTALYEIIPMGDTVMAESDMKKVKEKSKEDTVHFRGSEVLQVGIRYKKPDEDKSMPLAVRVNYQSRSFDAASENLRWAASIAGFGMILRQSAYKGNISLANTINWAQQAKGSDKEGYRSECIALMQKAAGLVPLASGK